jgi:dienelactone hydrolase
VSKKLINVRDSINALLRTEPLMSFSGSNVGDWESWRGGFKNQLLQNLGRFPDRVPLDTEVIESSQEDGYTREKVVYDSERFASVPAYVLIPDDLKEGEKRPGILAAHGHGRGKVDVVGIAESEGDVELVRALNYDYAVKFVRRGYVVIAPDWRAFGEREPDAEWVRANRDKCNISYLAFGYFGYHLLALDIWDGMRTLDYLQSRPEVDPKRLGMVGLSFGGTMTTYLSALDPRIKVAVISGYISTVRGDSLTDRGKGNTCGNQYSPSLLLYGDIPDVAGLIAPRPLLVEMGEKDECFVIEDATRAYEHLSRIYCAAGASDKLDVDIFPGAHAFSGAKAFDWFEKYL